MSLGRRLSSDEIICLTALAFLHDLGKVAPAFQAIAWLGYHGPTAGHLQCGHYCQSVVLRFLTIGGISSVGEAHRHIGNGGMMPV